MTCLRSLQSIARRCLLLAVSPGSLNSVLLRCQAVSGHRLQSAVYWPHGNRTGGGTLLLQVASDEALTDLVTVSGTSKRGRRTAFGLPVCSLGGDANTTKFSLVSRVCSDASIWPTTSNGLPTLAETASQFDGKLTVSPRSTLPGQPGLTKALLTTCCTMDQQAHRLNQLLHLSRDELLCRQVFVQNLETALSCLWPGLTVQVHGSHASRVASRASDLDLLLVMPGGDVGPKLSGPVYRAECKRLRTVGRVLQQLDPVSRSNSHLFSGKFNLLHVAGIGLINCKVDICFMGEVNREASQASAVYANVNSHPATAAWLPALLHTVKYLSYESGLVTSGPSRGFTGFKLYALLLHYLQLEGLVPPLDEVMPFIDYEAHEVEAPQEQEQQLVSFEEPPGPEDRRIVDLLAGFLGHLIALKPREVLLCLATGRMVRRSLPTKTSEGGDDGEPRLDVVLCPNPFKRHRNILHGIGYQDWELLISWAERLRYALETAAKPQLTQLQENRVDEEEEDSVMGAVTVSKLSRKERKRQTQQLWGLPLLASVKVGLRPDFRVWPQLDNNVVPLDKRECAEFTY